MKKEFLDFIKYFENKNDDEIRDVLRSADYKFAAKKAAVVLLQLRGYFSFDEKERLLKYYDESEEREKSMPKVNVSSNSDFAVKLFIAILFFLIMMIMSGVRQVEKGKYSVGSIENSVKVVKI